MLKKIPILALLISLASAATPSVSRAAIVETILDPFSEAPVGSISFPTFTGSSSAGVLFSYAGFSEADITSITWTVDPGTYDVTALALSAFQGDNPCPNGTMDCSNRSANLSASFASTGSSSCSFSGEIGACREGIGFGPIAFRPIPEPSTWAMMLVGFAGLGFAGYRKSQRTARAFS